MLKKTVVLALLLLGSIPCIASAAFKLPATGQTTCYDTNGNVIPCIGTVQNGAYNINPISLTDNQDGTVTDNNTGLMWQQQENPTSYNWYVATGTYDGTSNPTTLNVCGSLNLDSYTDWRLPTEKELMSILDYSIPYPGPTINPTFFPNANSNNYWAISPVANNNGKAWYVDFSFGDVEYDYETTMYYVRCVRGVNSAPLPRFTDNGDSTTTDNYTGLTWQQSPASAAVSWSSALSYCQGLSLGNPSYTNWRLPNVKELESITDNTKSGLVVDTSFFPGAQAAAYWSSTTVTPNGDGTSRAWIVDFTDANVNYYGNKLSTTPSEVAMCVRGGHLMDRIGVFVQGGQGNGRWYLEYDGNGAWDGTPTDVLFSNFGGGVAGAVPVTGDWTGSGKTKIGIFVNGTWYLDLNGNGQWDGTPTDGLFMFGGGVTGAVPVTGDWNGSGTTKLGVFVPGDGRWYLDLNGNGQWDGTPTDGLFMFGGGIPNAIPVTGDWNGSGTTKIGVFDPATARWYLDYDGSGTWDGTATDKLYNFGGGIPNAIPVTGDWNGSGTTKIGVFDPATARWYLDYDGSGTWDGTATDKLYNFGGGLTGALPVTGKW